MYLLRQENKIKTPSPRIFLSLSWWAQLEALCLWVVPVWEGTQSKVRCRWTEPHGEPIRAVPAPGRASACRPHNPISTAKTARLCHQPALTPVWGSPAQPAPVQIRSWTGHLLSRVSLPVPITQVLKQLTFRSASPPAFSSHSSLPPDRWSHYRTQLLLHVESW